MIELIVTIAVLIGCLKLFPKLYKEVHKLDVEEYEDIIYLSDCCGWEAVGHIHITGEGKNIEAMAMCSKCYENTEFYGEVQ